MSKFAMPRKRKDLEDLNLHPGTIIRDILSYFVSSSFITIMIMFFSNDEDIEFTKVVFSKFTWIVFCIIVAFEILYNIVTKSDRWFGKPEQMVVHRLVDLETAVDKKSVVPQAISVHGRKLCAIHEAGHAFMSYWMDAPIIKVSMTGRNPNTEIEDFVSSSQDVKKMVLILYAGAVAEEVLLGELSTGSMGNLDSDFLRATQYIKMYITMTDESLSKAMLDEELSSEIISLSKTWYSMAKDILVRNMYRLDILANKLMEENELSGQAICELMSGNVQ